MSNEDLPISKIASTEIEVTWTSNEDGTNRQFWENSGDKDKTWTVSFTVAIHPKKPPILLKTNGLIIATRGTGAVAGF